ncbi:hypothetical protein XENTR_v10006941 [Xenopus tropicalis]|nr:hypothetical protein XENTR_v10006941 [Xenopus tropicalis]
MSGKKRSAKFLLRRSLSEQLKDSTSKAWDLLWKNVREKRLAGIVIWKPVIQKATSYRKALLSPL